MYSLLAELNAHDLEVAETLIGVIRFLLIFLAARALAEVLVRLSLPTIVGELLAGVVIGASGFHLLIPPSAGTCLLYTSPSPRDKRQSRMPSSA